jgi:hypothetical protein
MERTSAEARNATAAAICNARTFERSSARAYGPPNDHQRCCNHRKNPGHPLQTTATRSPTAMRSVSRLAGQRSAAWVQIRAHAPLGLSISRVAAMPSSDNGASITTNTRYSTRPSAPTFEGYRKPFSVSLPTGHLRSASRKDPRRRGISRSPTRPSLQRVERLRRHRDMSGAASPHRSRSQPTASCSNGIRSSTRWLTSIDMSSSEQSPTSRRGAACTPTTAARFEPTRPHSARFAHFTSSS